MTIVFFIFNYEIHNVNVYKKMQFDETIKTIIYTFFQN